MKQMISLLILFFAFAKYGEPKAMIMSLQGDVNLVMLETSVQISDTVGFMYDDQFGGFAINPSYCPIWNRRPTSFVVRHECTVRVHTEFDETPSDEHYRASHNPNYPSRGSGTNLIIGRRASLGTVRTTVSKRGEAFAFASITRRMSKRNSQIYCNDKDHRHYKNLLKIGFDNGHTVIQFGRNNKNSYEQTMKCIAVLKTPKNTLYVARLFTVIISDLEQPSFAFQVMGLGEQGAVEGAPAGQASFSAITGLNDSLVETNFAFQTDTSGSCQPTITKQPRTVKVPAFAFSYNDREQRMPRLDAGASHNCGVAVGQAGTSGQTVFRYWCECKE